MKKTLTGHAVTGVSFTYVLAVCVSCRISRRIFRMITHYSSSHVSGNARPPDTGARRGARLRRRRSFIDYLEAPRPPPQHHQNLPALAGSVGVITR